MSLRRLVSRLAPWVAVCALILRAGVPLLAAGAAQVRGVAVAEICSVYGVVHAGAAAHPHADQTPDDSERPEPGSPSDAAHGGDTCALTALGALASTSSPITAEARAHITVADLAPASGEVFYDACASWAARRKHEPPARA